MKRHSCGAILYTILNNKIYIILGMEKGRWFPFKGVREKGETNELAAIREIYEETCGIIQLDNIELKCNYSTKRKHYHIGLIKTSNDVINNFYKNRNYILNNEKYIDNYFSYLEKSDIKMFPLENIFSNNFHEVTAVPIKYYYTYLKLLENRLNNTNCNRITDTIQLIRSQDCRTTDISKSPYLTSMSNKHNSQFLNDNTLRV